MLNAWALHFCIASLIFQISNTKINQSLKEIIQRFLKKLSGDQWVKQ